MVVVFPQVLGQLGVILTILHFYTSFLFFLYKCVSAWGRVWEAGGWVCLLGLETLRLSPNMQTDQIRYTAFCTFWVDGWMDVW